ncbi:hypothetical protein [Halorubrum sp. Atlit-28R]|uniref:hypothetical protein n=1 Tax=Halorubrum sp. Atlit-28R TaxID=2282129 RepID=UPI000EF28173|nr:hypothetical protein [Halorubrum sp. Atlit-28R]RLM51654.1 hypothetical protein DVK06_04445 [Halorubrum sp. Atlit-28R]
MKRRELLRRGVAQCALGLVASALGGLSRLYSSAVTPPPGRAATPRSLDAADGVARNRVGGRYALTYDWTDGRGRRWSVDLSVPRPAYAAAARRPRGYLSALESARTDPHARRLVERIDAANALENRNGVAFPDTARFERAVSFVRSLPYVTDTASKGVPDYVRAVPETLVDAGGDCEDLTYLLVGMLSQPPFGYRTALAFLPGHVLVGVHRADLPTTHADAATLPEGPYVPVESVRARPIGEFRDEPVLAVYGDGLEFVDRTAIAETAAEVARDPSELETLNGVLTSLSA